MSLIALAIAAAVQSAPPAPPKVDCGDADHRALDFWIGDWNVTPTGSAIVVARSRIEKIAGCAISETFDQDVGPGGRKADYHGRSISSFVPADRNWRQFYVDNAGTAATLTGTVVDGAMIFLSRNGPVHNRMTISANADGSVRQKGEGSTDGKAWTPSYDFTYRPRLATP